MDMIWVKLYDNEDGMTIAKEYLGDTSEEKLIATANNANSAIVQITVASWKEYQATMKKMNEFGTAFGKLWVEFDDKYGGR